MKETSLRIQLIGAWTLASFVERDIATGVEEHPWGERPSGLLLYTPDGYMSAQLQRPGRSIFAGEDPMGGSPDEYAAAASSYIAYSGRFFVDEGMKSLAHEMAVSLFPNWLDQRQARSVRMDGDSLELSVHLPTARVATLTWRRARPN